MPAKQKSSGFLERAGNSKLDYYHKGLQWHPDVLSECATVAFKISVFHCDCSVIAKVYSGIQMYRRSVPILPLIISVSHVNCPVITKVYSGIQIYRRSVPLLLLIISVFHFNCSIVQFRIPRLF